jgi:hypothetical protein
MRGLVSDQSAQVITTGQCLRPEAYVNTTKRGLNTARAAGRCGVQRTGPRDLTTSRIATPTQSPISQRNGALIADVSHRAEGLPPDRAWREHDRMDFHPGKLNEYTAPVRIHLRKVDEAQARLFEADDHDWPPILAELAQSAHELSVAADNLAASTDHASLTAQ